MRDPTSDFGFLCYLRERGQLVDFLNHKTLFPLRIEFHGYFEWTAARVGHLVEYGTEVVSVEPVTEDGEVRWFDVVSRVPGDPDRTVVRRAGDICLVTGMEPHLPPGTVLSERIWHNSELVPRVAELTDAGAPVRRAVVLDAGQSAAEAVDYLHRSFRRPSSARSSPSTATRRPTTVPSPTGSSTPRRWTSASTPRPA
jgi:L-ornithine N5-oxygenase